MNSSACVGGDCMDYLDGSGRLVEIIICLALGAWLTAAIVAVACSAVHGAEAALELAALQEKTAADVLAMIR